jgi:pilus assembly protein CpaF
VYVRRDSDDVHAEPTMFSSQDALAGVVQRMVRATGLPFDESHPIVDARLADGTRVNAVHHACATNGPVVTLTRPVADAATLEGFVEDGVLSEGMSEFLDTCVRTRCNVIISGAPGAHTAALTTALAARIPAEERIVVVEAVPEIVLPQPHVVTLEATAPSRMRELVANALRMSADRLVVHDMVAGEAFEVVLAMAGGQDGAIVSTQAVNAQDCLQRMVTMVGLAGPELGGRAVRQQIADAVDVVVCVTRFADGSHRVTEIVEVTGADMDLFTTQEIFTFKRDASGGRFQAKGEPRFYQELKKRGEQLNMAIFRDGA